MANGLLPYVDFIDVKGPLLFVIQLVGWEISRGTTTGVWLLETGAVFLTLLSLYKLGRVEKLTRSQACLASLLCLTCMFSSQLYGGGGRVEVYTGCALALLLWRTCRFYRCAEMLRHEVFRYGVAVGVCFGVCLLMKYNACLPAAAAGACACVYLLKRRRFRALSVLLGGIAAGAGAICLPFAAWMAWEGILDDCFNVYFKLNAETLHSSVELDATRIVWLLSKAVQSSGVVVAIFGLPFLFAASWRRDGNFKAFALFLIGISAFVSAFAGQFPYYMLYCSVLAIFPAVIVSRGFYPALSAKWLVLAAVAVSYTAIRLNGTWDSQCHMRLTHKIPPAIQAMEDEIGKHPGCGIMFVGTLDMGLGFNAPALPACPEWFTLNGAPEYYVQRQFEAVRRRRADYVGLGTLNLENTKAIAQLIEEAGYVPVASQVPNSKTGSPLILYKLNAPRGEGGGKVYGAGQTPAAGVPE